MNIAKAIVPVAGLGTRLLPTTKSLSKEMLPVGRLPVVHHVVEELAAAGIRQILFITGRNKSAIENHFDDSGAQLATLATASAASSFSSRTNPRPPAPALRSPPGRPLPLASLSSWPLATASCAPPAIVPCCSG